MSKFGDRKRKLQPMALGHPDLNCHLSDVENTLMGDIESWYRKSARERIYPAMPPLRVSGVSEDTQELDLSHMNYKTIPASWRRAIGVGVAAMVLACSAPVYKFFSYDPNAVLDRPKVLALLDENFLAKSALCGYELRAQAYTQASGQDPHRPSPAKYVAAGQLADAHHVPCALPAGVLPTLNHAIRGTDMWLAPGDLVDAQNDTQALCDDPNAMATLTQRASQTVGAEREAILGLQIATLEVCAGTTE